MHGTVVVVAGLGVSAQTCMLAGFFSFGESGALCNSWHDTRWISCGIICALQAPRHLPVACVPPAAAAARQRSPYHNC